MAGGKSGKSSNVSSARKRAESQSASLKRGRDGSAFVRCEECNKDVAAALISMHNCNSEAKLKSNLDALVVENRVEIKKKLNRSAKEGSSEVASKKEKKSKDPERPKRSPTAFFLFMNDFRKTFKEEHPENKSVAVVAKEGDQKWKLLTDEEKKPYIDKAAEFKEEYEKYLKAQRDEEEDQGDSHLPLLCWEKSLVVVVVVVAVLVVGRRLSRWRI